MAQALPLTFAQFIHLLYNVVDRIFIGHMGGDSLALTGVGLTFPVVTLIMAFTALFGNGGVPLFSMARGAGNTARGRRIQGNSMALLLVSAVLLMAAGYAFRRPVLFAFGASEDSYIYAEQYLNIYLAGTVFVMITTGMNGYINAQGFPRIGMLSVVLGAVVNIILDPIFIFALDMGVRGAATATVISQAISAAWVLRFLTGPNAALRLKRSKIGVSKERLKRIVSLGLPGFVMQGTNSLVSIVCNNQLQSYGGDLYVGIMTILNSVREMLSLPMTGITHGTQPIIGFNYGAKKNERVKEGIRFAFTVGALYLLCAWIVIMLIPEQMIGIFSDEPETIAIGAQMLNIYFFGFVFMTFQSAGQMAFQALGYAKQAIFFSLFRKAIIVVPLTLLFPAIGFGVEGVFLAEPVSNVVGGLAAFTAMWFIIYRKL